MIRVLFLLLLMSNPVSASTCRLGLGSWADAASTLAVQMSGGLEVGGTAALNDAAAPVALVGKYLVKCWLIPKAGGSENLAYNVVEIPAAGAAAWNVGVIASVPSGVGALVSLVVMFFSYQKRYHPESITYTYPETAREK